MITEKEIDIGFAAVRKVLSYSDCTDEPVLIHTMNGFGEDATGAVVSTTRLVFGLDGNMYLADLYGTAVEVHRYACEGSWRVFLRDEYEDGVPETVEEGGSNEED